MRYLHPALILAASYLVACGSDAPPSSGEADTTDLDTSTVDAVADVGPDVETDTTSDDDTLADTESLAAFGDPCLQDAECDSGICLRVDASLDEGLCTELCTDTCDDDAYDCVFVTETGTDGQSICVPRDYCADVDGDTYGVGPGCTGRDCDESRADINPAADEVCDGVDNDCDGVIDDNPVGEGDACESGFLGACAAGHAVCGSGLMTCEADQGPTEERCDNVDNDCDGELDEDAAGEPLARECYDGPIGTHGVGVCRAGVQTCGAGDFGTCAGQVLPGAEVCDGLDNNCDGRTDEVDEDGDGFAVCPGAAADCDDTNVDIYPGALEVCNGLDDNCNGNIDEFATLTYYRDRDGDGFGDATVTIEACSAPEGYVEEPGDCADRNPDIHPDAPEVCNLSDDNCNLVADEGLERVTIYRDFDGDGYGADNLATRSSCLIDEDGDGVGETSPVIGYVAVPGDCNDASGVAYPGAAEVCDGILNDCRVEIADWLCPVQCDGDWPIALGGNSGYPAVAQLDSDGDLEIVTRLAGQVSAFNADGSVLWQRDASVNYSYPALADINQDGWMDVVTSENGAVAVYDGHTGADLVRVAVGGVGPWYGASVFDLDADGGYEIISTGSGTHVIHLSPAGAIEADVELSPLAGEPGFRLETPTVYDMDGDGVSEVWLGSGNWTCASDPTGCRGRQYVFNSDGSYASDPSWSDPAVPWFEVADFPESHSGEGRQAVIADVDGDGVAEYVHHFSRTGGYVWNLDGTLHPATGTLQHSNPILAPIDAAYELAADGALSYVGGPVADMDGDGVYEVFGSAGGITLMHPDGALTPSTIPLGGRPIIADINRDRRLDVLFIGGENNALNCYTFGADTYDDGRVLAYGGPTSAIGRSYYPTQSYDPFEPNQPVGTFDPATSTDPVGDTRAFSTRGFRDRYSSGSGWQRRIRAALGTRGDHDFYVHTGGYTRVALTDLVRDYDLHVHIYNQSTLAYIETRSSTSVGDADENVSCHSVDGCTGGPFLFITEVAPKDPDVDFGPHAYTLTHW